MRAYAHARGRVIIGIFTILFLVVFITSKSRKSIHPLLEKNKPSFYGKQAVVLWKTSRRFVKNKPSFCGKQAVVLWKTSRRFVENKSSFYEKQAVVL